MMAEILLYGTDHQTQKTGAGLFKEKLDYLIDDFGVQAIFEEWCHGETGTVAFEIANSRVPKLPWHNVGTPDTEEYKTFENHIFSGHTIPQFWIYRYGPLDVQTRRELFMVSKIKEKIASEGVALFVCGTGHLHSLAERLRAAAFDVKGFF